MGGIIPVIVMMALFAAPSSTEHRIGLILDSNTESTELLDFFNNTAEFVNDVLFIEEHKIDTPDPDAAKKEACDLAKDVNFILSLANNASAISGVKKMSAASGIPVIQTLFEPFTHATSGSGSGNELTLMSSEAVLMSILKPLFTAIGWTGSFVAIHDDQFINDEGLADILLTTGLTLMHRYDISQVLSTPTAVAADINAKAVTNVLILTSTKNAEKAVQALEDMFTTPTPYKWAFVSTDVEPFTCDTCEVVDLYWVRPEPKVMKHRRVDAAKQWLTKQKDDTGTIMLSNQLKSAYLMDMMDSINAYLTKTGTEKFPCDASKKYDLEFAKEFHAGFDLSPAYGNYSFYADNKIYQDIQAAVIRVKMDQKNRYIKKVGHWTPGNDVSATITGESVTADIVALQEKTLKIAIALHPPFIEKVNQSVKDTQVKDAIDSTTIRYVQIGDAYYRGYCIDLLEEIKKSIGFDYELYVVPDGYFGSLNERMEWNGLVQELLIGNADVALASISVMAERENFVDFTVPYYDLVGISLMMKRIKAEHNLFKFMTVLEPPVWGFIVGSYFFASLMLWLFDRFSPYSYKNNKEKYGNNTDDRVFTPFESLWFCLTSLTPQGGGDAPRNISGRLVAATWWLFGFIIIASYTANLAAFLTISHTDHLPTSLEDLAKQYKIKYAPVQGTASSVYFTRMAQIEEKFYDIWKAMSLNESMGPLERAQLAVWDYPISDKYTNIWRHMQEAGLPESTEEAKDRVLASPNATSGFAFVGDATEIRYAALTSCDFKEIGKQFSRKPYAIAVQQGSPLKDKFSSAILKLLNARDLERLKENWWTNNPNKVECETDEAAQGISIQNIGGVFVVILIGIALSIITLIIEFFYYRYKRSKAKKAEALAVQKVAPAPNANGTKALNAWK